MSRPDVSFKRIEIRRVPGFPRGGLDVDDLCPGVNIIYGPNGSGKTTLSRTIQTLLRPKGAPHEHSSLFASLELRGEPCTIDYDLGRVKCQRDGIDVDSPALAPADVGDRYVLALHDLILSRDDSDLAAEIVKESAGGYDLPEARAALGYRDRPSGKGKPTRELDEAVKTCRDAQNRQDELLEKEKQLAELSKKRTAARAAQMWLKWLQEATEHADAKARHKEARQKLEAFPLGVGKLAGDELQRLQTLRESLTDARVRRGQAQAELDKARRTIDKCALPEEGIAPDLPGALRLKCQRLQSFSSDVRTKQQQRDEAAAELEQARRNLGPAIDPGQLDRLDASAVEELSSFARRAERLRADIAAGEALRAWLGHDDQSCSEDPNLLNQGTWLLGRWIGADDASASKPSGRKLGPLVTGIAMAVFSLLMSLLVHWTWLLVLPAGGCLIGWALMPRREFDQRPDIRRDFEGLGVGVPGSWTSEEVRSFVRQLQGRCAEATMRQEKLTRWSDLSRRREDCARRQTELEQEKAQWTARLGISPEVVQADEAWLYLLGANINRLQMARQGHAAAEASVDSATRQYETLLKEVNEGICGFGFEPAGDPDVAAGRVEKLAEKQQTHLTAGERIAGSMAALKAVDEEIARSGRQQTALFERVDLSVEQESTLREWSRMREDYIKANDDLSYAQRALEAARTSLADRPELAAMSREKIDEERFRYQLDADQLELLNRQIGGIEAAIAAAKQSSDLEAALAHRAECADALSRARQQDYEAVVGNVLGDFLARHQRDREMPGLFTRAQDLFVKITHGRYRLDVDDGDPPGFRALDTDRNVGLSLDELSSGTRLQLLLAVRVAFLQRQEHGLKLPLILDETLGNSDERRAREIIDAAIGICRDGRQVFYFTAQHDEVGKWKSVLKEHEDVPQKLIDLGEVRRFSESERVPPMDYERPKPVEVPPPEELDWLAYGRRLGVPPLDPQGEPGGVHLWYLVDDLPTLYRLLKQGVNRWGQFQTLIEYGHDEVLCADSELFRRSEASARLLHSAARYWRIGRGVPVDRRVLVDSDAVSSTYIDRVSDLAAELSGNAAALIEALEAGQVRGFRTEKRNDLRDYLLEQGCLDERPVSTADEIRREVRLAMFSELDSGLLSVERFDQLVAAVVGAG